MYFKKLEILGFKSFPNKTDINFEPGTTAIIGPNGCGKTNISDAIRWVIGETSARSLRGHRMEDIIFNGTEVLKPLSAAEVSLTLNNEDKIIPIEYSEVTVTRRCYRSGESDYFINKNPCRLRDIQELFMDTGIGTESYSVMEQGKVDLILSSKPEDRRLVLEEAAGIAKYNSRKDAALRKLDLTEQNLLRVDDIIAEVKREIISIKRQVTKAEKYKESYERLKNMEISLAMKKYNAIKKERETFQAEIDGFKDESGRLTTEISREESKEEELHLKVIDIEKSLASARERFLASAERLNNIEKRELSLKERIEHLGRRQEAAGRELKDIGEKIIDARKRMEEEENKQNGLFENIREIEFSLTEKEKSFGSLQASLGDAEREVEDYKNRLFEKAREITNLNNDIEKININLADIARRVVRLSREMQKGKEDEKGISLKIDAVTTLLLEWDKFFDTYSRSISAILKEVEKIGGSPRGLIPELIKIEADLGLGARKKELERLQGEILEISSAISGSRRKEDETKNISLELEELEDEKGRFDSMLIQKRQNLESLEKERQELKEEIDRKTEGFQSLKQGLETARESKEKARFSFAGLQEKRGGMELHLRTLRERLEEYIQSQARLREEIARSGSEYENFKNEIEGLKEEKENFLKEKASFKEEMERLEEERKNADSIFREEEERLRRERLAVNKRLEELHKLELSTTQKDAELSSIRERMSNLYQVDLETVTAEPVIGPLMQSKPEVAALQDESPSATPVVEMAEQSTWPGPGAESMEHSEPDAALTGAKELSEEEVRAEIDNLRQTLEKMGPVNIMAIEENKELEDRFSLLKKEREDILKAREELQQIISKINHTCRDKFGETVEKVKEEFHKIFRLLFNGGKADLILQEGDILESGIEIVAKPPGKNLSTISQMSGGEKALTAIALLFALFRIRPSPFCVLDEIDAPLDDSNIGRFGNMLKEFQKTTQFIIITHNKKTIALAQVIYGITMEQAGISKIVSVKFKDSETLTPV